MSTNTYAAAAIARKAVLLADVLRKAELTADDVDGLTDDDLRVFEQAAGVNKSKRETTWEVVKSLL